ncbi:MAG: hypothetical protein GC168_09890 [Candidatus Hydrogenedens sp.]|nr:hypothetical protein [Candidatus Hydrogenedens sp.]
MTSLIACVAAVLISQSSLALSIPPSQVDEQRVYWGNTDNFDKPAEVDYKAVVVATPEYQEMKKKKVEKGTAKYWILLNSASERALRVIAAVAKESEFDLVVDRGFMAALEPPIEANDITEGVLKSIEK